MAKCMICAKESILPLLRGTCRGCHRLIQAREADMLEARQISEQMPVFSFFEDGVKEYKPKFRRSKLKEHEESH